ncbi:MAG: hypothetical protein ACUVTN_09765 [Thermodesulfobacteriota bacterium]
MRKILIFTALLFSTLIFSSLCFAQNFYGWWKCFSGGVEEGDFVTGEWVKTLITIKKGSYLYIDNTNKAYLIQWDDDGQKFFLENEFSFFERNNIIVFRGPYGFDEDGELLNSSTAILKTSLPAHLPNKIDVTYTRYDLNELYVKRFNLKFTRVRDLTTIPVEVKSLIP